jgi:endo-1,4-beta-mannosidase
MIHLCRSSGQRAVPTAPEAFIVGVNYWPRTAGVDFFRHFDVDAFHEDFATMADLGLNYARLFLSWSDFQPDPESLSCAALSHLLEVCDAAAAESIKLELMLFSGHIGQLNSVPAWLVDREMPRGSLFPTLADGQLVETGIRNPFSNPLARRAAMRLVRGVARSVGSHPAVASYNLGNEPDLLAAPQCVNEAHEWFAELRQALGNIDPKHPVTCSLGGRNLIQPNGLRVDRVFSSLDYSTIDREGLACACQPPAHREKLALFNCALTSALTQKRTVLQEWDSPFANTDPSQPHDREVANYAENLLPKLVEQGARGAILWWFADVEQSPSPCCKNRLFGLLDGDGKLRPHGEVLRNFLRTKPKVVTSPARPIALPVTPDDFYERPREMVETLLRDFVAA